MKRYKEYKDSCLPWASKLPLEWKVTPLKHAYRFQTGATPPTKTNQYFEGDNIWVNISDLKGKVVYDSFKHISDAALKVCSMNISPKGSLMFSFKLSVGTVAFCGCDMYTNEAIATFLRGKNDLNYLYYAGPFFIIKNANENIYGAKLLNQDLIKNAKIFLPPLSEQQSIASFLDAKTKPIEAIISKREKQIELLEEMKSAIISRAVTKGLNPNAKMKDSRVEWIGEVPEEWELIKTSLLFRLIGSGTTPSKNGTNYADEGLHWLQTGDLNDGYISDTSKYITELAVQENSALTLFSKGSLVIAMYGATIGKIGILDIDSYTNQACCVLGKGKGINTKYAFYAYHAGKEALINESRGGGQPNISQDIIRHFIIPVPKLFEQRAIASYLDTETSKIDARIAKHRKQIALLQEYKQALITDAVTGKIDVREINS